MDDNHKARTSIKKGFFWEPPRYVHSQPQDIVIQIRKILEEAVRKRIQVENLDEIPVFLSGGFDSAVVASLINQLEKEKKIRMLSVGYDTKSWQDERNYARELAKFIKKPFEEVQLTSKEIPELFTDAAILTEDPIQDPVVLPTLALARVAKQYSKIVLTGDGSDEIWGGYERFSNLPNSYNEYLYRTMIFTPEELDLNAIPESYFKSIDFQKAEGAQLDNIMRLELSNRLRNYHLSRLDKITMGVGLEARCPFLDVKVVNLGLSISSSAKCRRGTPKGILHDSFSDILPKWLINRKKQPFSVPIKQWLLGDLNEFMVDTLTTENAFVKSFVSSEKYLKQFTKENPKSEKIAAKIWSLLQLEIWYRSFASNLI